MVSLAQSKNQKSWLVPNSHPMATCLLEIPTEPLLDGKMVPIIQAFASPMFIKVRIIICKKIFQWIFEHPYEVIVHSGKTKALAIVFDSGPTFAFIDVAWNQFKLIIHCMYFTHMAQGYNVQMNTKIIWISKGNYIIAQLIFGVRWSFFGLV